MHIVEHQFVDEANSEYRIWIHEYKQRWLLSSIRLEWISYNFGPNRCTHTETHKNAGDLRDKHTIAFCFQQFEINETMMLYCVCCIQRTSHVGNVLCTSNDRTPFRSLSLSFRLSFRFVRICSFSPAHAFCLRFRSAATQWGRDNLSICVIDA